MFVVNRWSNDRIVIVILLLVLFGYLGYRYLYSRPGCLGSWGSAPQGPDGSQGPAPGGSGQKPQVVLYFSHGCPHCVNFLPEWRKFAQFARSNLPQVDVKEIACEGEQQKICMDHKVPGFPTVRMYKASGQVEYDGNRTAQSLMEFVNKNTQ